MPAFAMNRAAPAAAINITPLVDVMLVLLVIFMLAVPLQTSRLPLVNGASCPACASDTPVRLAIKRTGEMYWDGAAVTRAQLRANLRALAANPRTPALELHVEPSARYDTVTDAVAAAQDAGVHAIGVVAGD